MTTQGAFLDRDTEAAALSRLPDGRYHDGTYEWDKEAGEWTPLRAPYGMPSRPRLRDLSMVLATRVPLFTDGGRQPGGQHPTPVQVGESIARTIEAERDAYLRPANAERIRSMVRVFDQCALIARSAHLTPGPAANQGRSNPEPGHAIGSGRTREDAQ